MNSEAIDFFNQRAPERLALLHQSLNPHAMIPVSVLFLYSATGEGATVAMAYFYTHSYEHYCKKLAALFPGIEPKYLDVMLGFVHQSSFIEGSPNHSFFQRYFENIQLDTALLTQSQLGAEPLWSFYQRYLPPAIDQFLQNPKAGYFEYHFLHHINFA